MTERAPEKQLLADLVEAAILLLHAARRSAALELALRRSRALLPGDLEAAERYLNGFADDAMVILTRRLQAVRGPDGPRGGEA